MKENLWIDEENSFEERLEKGVVDLDCCGFWTRKRMRKSEGRTCTEMLGL